MKKIKTLIVDDSSLSRESLKMFLEDRKEIELVGLLESGEECVKFVKKTLPELIIMDARMPGIDGPTATKDLKKENPDIKVIIFTIWAEQEAKDYAKNCGADDYFIKGEPLTLLMEKINNLF
ncbi:MAG: response regulator transcription factor [Actinomycetia bacterium]|nr:response regulator transcription factor [Actinomycetes bacterium]